MPRRGGKLTPQERVLSASFAGSGSVNDAAKQARYRQVTSAHHALARPAVAAEVQRIQSERMLNEALPLAVDFIIDALSPSSTMAGPVRLGAAKLTLEYVKEHGSAAAGGKEEHEMTTAELDAEIERTAHLGAVLRRRAAIIEAQDADYVDVTAPAPSSAFD